MGPGRAAPARSRRPFVFWLLVSFLVLEYARPPLVAELKLQMLLILAFPVLWWLGHERPWTPILTTQLAFLGWCLKSLPIATNNYMVYFMSRLMIGNLSIALALTWVCARMEELRRVVWIWVGIITYQAVWALTHQGRGTGGFLGDENDLALACGSALPFAFAGFDRFRGWARWLCGLVLAVLVAAIVGTVSRGGFVGLIVTAVYCLFASRHRLRNLGLVLFAMLALPLYAPETFLDEVRSIRQTSEGTAQNRRFLWAASVNMWKAHPILGVGAGNASYRVGEFQPESFEERRFQERDWSGRVVHSLYFETLAEHGLPGVVLIGLVAWLHFRTLRRLRRTVRQEQGVPGWLRRDVELYAIGLNGALICFLTSGIFLSVTYYPYLWHFTALAGAMRLAVCRELARRANAVPDAGLPGGLARSLDGSRPPSGPGP